MPTKKSTTKIEAKIEEGTEKMSAPKGHYFYGTGKRKTSIAKVRLFKGSGNIQVNNKAASQYFPLKTLIGTLKTPLTLTGTVDKFDIVAVVEGGGLSSQAEAMRHGISKALVIADLLNKSTLKKAGLLTRDSRIKERKKFGLKRARRGPQFSKR